MRPVATQLITIKVSPETRTMLRVLAAHEGKEMHEVAGDVLWAEMKRRKIDLGATMKMIKRRIEGKGERG
jgi:hypothetical protein